LRGKPFDNADINSPLFRIEQFGILILMPATPPSAPSEIAEILAAGLMRLLGKKSSLISHSPPEKSVDIMRERSGHPGVKKRRENVQ
jgi:hypothetical protein